MNNQMVIKSKILVVVLIGFLFSCSKPITYQAHKLYNQMAYIQAIEKYNMVAGKDSANTEVLSRLADCYRLTNQSEEAELWYAKVVKLPDAKPINRLYYGQALMRNGKYEQAQTWLDTYSASQAQDERGGIFVESIKNLDNFFANKDSYTIKNLEINSKEDDFSPTLYGKGLVFASNRVNESFVQYNHAWNDKPFSKIYFSVGQKHELSNPELFLKSVQTKYHDGAVTFTGDGNTMFFTRNNIVKGKVYKSERDIVKLKIFSSHKNKTGWGNPVEFQYNNHDYHMAHPAVSADGTKLYFSSDMPNGEGGMDLYVCERTESGWGLPVNLGPKVNTKGNEIFPFLHDDKTLYFASNGHKGLGGLDNYFIRNTSGEWSSPVNVGNPVNTKYDDFGIILNSNNDGGYFSSDRPGGKGGDDIYAFERLNMPVNLEVLVYDKETNEPLDKVLVQIVENVSNTEGLTTGTDGKVFKEVELNQNFDFKANKEGYQEGIASLASTEYDRDNKPFIKIPLEKVANISVSGAVSTKFDGAPMKDVVVKITLLNTSDNSVREYTAGPDGKYHFDLLPNSDYKIVGVKDGCTSNEEFISTKNIIGEKEFAINLEMFCVGDIIRIDNIYYDLDKYYIRPDAAIELDKLVLTMNDYSGLKIELRSHTDSRGSDAYNERLSDNRAKSAVAYLVSKGIVNSRMVAKGYGEKVLTNQCSNGVKCSKAEHQANRRTEFKILSVE
ncbi:MAG: OmpA family protein [Bacteroidia bacterium]|nr:OmpA family protein [Bacteroidia bacterium]